MVILVGISGAIWGIDSLFFAARRRATSAESVPPDPVLVDYARSFFPIFLIVLVLRSFIVEPFRIPSGSMIPTLLIGDFILVNKYDYGIRLPLINKKVIEIGNPERGDVVVFRYPNDPSTPFIKRIVGLPGDKIVYENHELFINGEKIETRPISTYVGLKSAAVHTGAKLLEEDLLGHDHQILWTTQGRSPSFSDIVPPDSYFVLGDNRDNSRDSRYWGFVPDENLIGRAFMIWMNWDNGPTLSRIGDKIR